MLGAAGAVEAIYSILCLNYNKIPYNLNLDNEIPTNKINFIKCNIFYYNLYELKEIKKKLTKVSPIKNLIVKSISLKKTEYQIYFYGDLKIFADILKMNQLMINYETNYCTIKLK